MHSVYTVSNGMEQKNLYFYFWNYFCVLLCLLNESTHRAFSWRTGPDPLRSAPDWKHIKNCRWIYKCKISDLSGESSEIAFSEVWIFDYFDSVSAAPWQQASKMSCRFELRRERGMEEDTCIKIMVQLVHFHRKLRNRLKESWNMIRAEHNPWVMNCLFWCFLLVGLQISCPTIEQLPKSRITFSSEHDKPKRGKLHMDQNFQTSH